MALDRAGLRDVAPLPPENLIITPGEAKLVAERYIEAVVDAIGADGGQPDLWESAHLSVAIPITISQPWLAVKLCAYALEEPGDRWLMPPADPPLTIADLRALLEFARQHQPREGGS